MPVETVETQYPLVIGKAGVYSAGHRCKMKAVPPGTSREPQLPSSVGLYCSHACSGARDPCALVLLVLI